MATLSDRATIELVAARRVLVAMLLSVCLGASVAEMFDRWDHTPADGNDTEANLIVVAVCVAVGFVTATAILRRIGPDTSQGIVRLSAPFAQLRDPWVVVPTPTSSPPAVLRI